MREPIMKTPMRTDRHGPDARDLQVLPHAPLPLAENRLDPLAGGRRFYWRAGLRVLGHLLDFSKK